AGDLLGAFLYRAPRSFAFQWRRNGAVIAGATTSTRIASRAGLYSCRVTAANAAGGKTQRSSDHKVFPDTKITEVKIDHSKQSAKFSFTGVGRPTGFQCALIKAKKNPEKKAKPHFSSCSSPKGYKHLKA